MAAVGEKATRVEKACVRARAAGKGRSAVSPSGRARVQATSLHRRRPKWKKIGFQAPRAPGRARCLFVRRPLGPLAVLTCGLRQCPERTRSFILVLLFVTKAVFPTSMASAHVGGGQLPDCLSKVRLLLIAGTAAPQRGVHVEVHPIWIYDGCKPQRKVFHFAKEGLPPLPRVSTQSWRLALSMTG